MPALEHWFTGPALGAFLALLASIGTLSFAWYSAAAGQADRVQQRLSAEVELDRLTQVKNALGRSLASGRQLIAAHENARGGAHDADADRWVSDTRDLVASAYGEGEALLFMDDSGYTFHGVNIANTWIEGRMRRLTELLRRTDVLAVRKDFDGSKLSHP